MKPESLHLYDHSYDTSLDTSLDNSYDNSGLAIVHLRDGPLDTNNPFVTTLEAIRSGTYVSGYIYNPDGTAWTPTGRDKGFLPPLTMHELHHYLPQAQSDNNGPVPLPPAAAAAAAAANTLPPPPQPQLVPWTNIDWIRQSSAFIREYQQPQPTSFIPTTSAPGIFARHAAAHPDHGYQHQPQQHDHFLDHSSLTSLQATPPSPLSPIQEISSPVKPPDTPTPAPRVTRQRSSGSGKHLVEIEKEEEDDNDEEEEDESSSETTTLEDSSDEDYKPSRQKRVKKMTTAVRRSSRRTSGMKPDL